MKKTTSAFAFMLSTIIFGQVGIKTQTPHASSDLELGSHDKALYLNRVANPPNDIANPQPGMMLYDTTLHCIRIYQGQPPAWSVCLKGTVGTITALTCTSAAFSPATATQGTGYSGTLTIPYTGGNGGTYAAQSFVQNGLTFTLTAGTFANGAGNLVYSVSGTPTASGTTSVNVTAGGQSCNGLALSVNAIAPTNPVGTGTLTGKSCFDVVEVFVSNDCGTIASRTSQKANFAQTATNTQTYTFTPTGTVSNVRFVYVNTNGQVIQSLTGGNSGNNISTPVTATVVYYNNLNAAATGLSRDAALLADIYVIYNDGASNNGTDRQLKLTARVQDCVCCGAYIAAGVWREFMCLNLGVTNQTLDPYTPAAGIHGAKWQWGKLSPILTQAQDQANSGSISGWVDFNNVATNSWNPEGKTKGSNDPCPTGYRIPTKQQLEALSVYNTATSIGTFTGSATNYGSVVAYGPSYGSYTLAFPTTGRRSNTDGSLTATWSGGLRGTVGHYWTSTSTSDINTTQDPLTANRYGAYFQQGGVAQTEFSVPSYGKSIRCIKY